MRKKSGGGRGGRTLFSWRRNLEVGVLVRVCVCVSYLAALCTSFASTDVVGEKLFLKAHLKNLRCYKTKRPHVFVCACVPVSELRLT